MEPTHKELLNAIRKLDERLDALERSQSEQEGAVKMAKWLLALLIALGGIGVAMMKFFDGAPS
jgi:hypothetical protein